MADNSSGKTLVRWVVIVLLLIMVCAESVFAGPTTGLRLIRFGADGSSVLAERTVDYRWLESNLPVLGDGVTHYYHQGPVFVDSKTGQWDPNETTNFKDRGSVKGTDLKDLCNLIGGMDAGDAVMVHAADGYHVEFGYPNVYTPASRQGPMAICWYNGEDAPTGERQGTGFPPDYFVGMRLVFFADTSGNTEGKHVFGNWDMHEVMPNESIHLFDNLYPSTSGYNVKWVDEIRIYTGGYKGENGSPGKTIADQVPRTTSAPITWVPLIAGLIGAALITRRK
jgi:hypothetical protein